MINFFHANEQEKEGIAKGLKKDDREGRGGRVSLQCKIHNTKCSICLGMLVLRSQLFHNE